MKKLIALLLILILAVSSAAAEQDNEFTGLSYIELMGKLGKVQRAMWACDEWTSVDVQAGVYRIGEDIPAGHWSITAAAENDFYTIGYGTKLNATGTGIDDDSLVDWWTLSSDYSSPMLHRLDIILEEGYYIELGHKSTFQPYSGKSTPQFHFD